MPAELSADTLRFLAELRANNSKPWFDSQRARFERIVRDPMLQLVADLQPVISRISPNFVADPRKQGGSLLRIYRDTRFSTNKLPYKTWTSLKLFHQRSRQVSAPSFYLHIEPGHSFIGAGLWRPEAATLRRLREFIVDNPGAWKAATGSAHFTKRFEFGGDSLQRPPRGFPADHPLIVDLKRKDFVVAAPWSDQDWLAAGRLTDIEADLHLLAPFVDYLCAALELEF